MDWKMTLLNERIKGREEGRKEGREEGRKEGRKEGREEGRKEGREEGLLMHQIETIKKKVQKGIDLPEIAEAMEMDVDAIRPVWEAVKAAAPDYDQEKILKTIMGR